MQTSFNKTDKSSRCALSISITSVQRMKEYLPSFQIKASENMAVCRTFRYLESRGGSAKRRAAPAFEILMLAPVRRFFPEPRQRLNGSWRCSRVLHPSEDLSELPPLREAVAGQEYHCPRTRSRQNSLPKLLWDGWYRSSPYWAAFMQEHRSRTGGLRASSASLFHFWLIRLMSFSRWICTFQAARERSKNTSHPLSTSRDPLHQTFFTLASVSAI